VGADSVDLTARTSGLLPFWLFLILLGIWLATLIYFWTRRETRPALFPQCLAGGALVLANVLFFWRPLFTAAHLPQGGGDLNSFFFTLHAYSADRVTSGEIPFWNQFLHGGMPHLGNFQAGFLYPPNLIAYFVAQPFSYGTLEWLAIAHYLIASLGVYLLLRALGAGRIGSVAGGILFAYSGFFVAHLGHFSMISAAAWIPWLWWAVHRLLERRSWWDAVVLALLVFLTASGGHQQTLLFALGGAGVWWLFLILQKSGLRVTGIGVNEDVSDVNQRAFSQLRSRDTLTSIGQFGTGVIAGLLLALPMILPSLQLAQRSVRSTLSIDQAQEFSVQPVALLQLILPTVFGSNPTDFWGDYSSGEIWGYIGVTTLVVAGLGLALRPSAYRIFFVGVAVLALLYAVGPAVPVHGWFYQFVPGFDLVRAPARAYVYFNLAIAVLAGLTISDLGSRAGNLDARAILLANHCIKFLVLAVGATGLIVIPFFYTQILGVNDPPNRPVITVDNLWMMMLFLSLLLATVYLWRLGALRSVALGIGLTVLLALDVFSATMPFNPTEDDIVANYRDPEIVAFLEEEWADSDPFRVDNHHPELLPNFGMIDGFHVASGVFDPMQPAAYTTTYNVVSELPENPAYDLLNARFMIRHAGAEDEPEGFELVFEGQTGSQIWERETALPRGWFVSDVVDLDRESQIDAMRSAEFDPAEQVLIEDPPVTPDDRATGTVELLEYSPERLRFGVDAEGPGYVVISEGDYPGWVAEIDGESAEILTANHGIRAVAVDAEMSEIELRYESGLVTLGWIGTITVALIVAGMVLTVSLYTRQVPGKRNT
jgi:hypothetical protein